MQPDGYLNTGPQHPMAESAKGWHSIQLGVMGFIGFCGVLRMGETPTGPEWLGWWSGTMSVLAFLTSLVSTWMVGSVAFPFYGADPAAPAPPANAAGRLRSGIRMTFVSLAMMGLAAAAAWWPSGASAANVEVKDARGNSACGTWLTGAPSGVLWLQTSQGRMTINIEAITAMSPVSSC